MLYEVITDAPRLAQQISVESEWSGALEAVLQGYLQDVCIDNTVEYISALKELDAVV